MRMAVDILLKVHRGELPYDRTIKVSVTEGLEKVQILGRMPHNLKTVQHLQEENERDFRKMISSRTSENRRDELLEEMNVRRRKMVKIGRAHV